jgi:hypothetical protein
VPDRTSFPGAPSRIPIFPVSISVESMSLHQRLSELLELPRI